MPLEEDDKGPLFSSRANPSARSLPSRVLRLLVLFLVVCITFSAVSVYLIRHFGVQSPVATVKSSLQPCFVESNSLDNWIRPPSNLLHTMNDQELFWRSTMVPRMKKYPFKRVPKIAFMFLTKGPMPLAPLWENFLRGHEQRYSIYVHSSPSFHPHFQPSSVFYKRHIPSQVLLILLFIVNLFMFKNFAFVPFPDMVPHLELYCEFVSQQFCRSNSNMLFSGGKNLSWKNICIKIAFNTDFITII